MNRRTFLGFPASSDARDKASGGSVPIIDTHIHLFDPTRSEGIPWPEKGNKDDEILCQPALPGRYRQITGGLGIVGAIKVECSPWLEDNQWVLDVAASDPLIVGTVGNLEPGTPDFLKHLQRFHQNPLFGASDMEISGAGILRTTCRERDSFLTFKPWRMPIWGWIRRIRTPPKSQP